MPREFVDTHPINYPGIKIQYDAAVDPTFHLTIRELLSTIASRPHGNALLTQLGTRHPHKIPAAFCNVIIRRASPRRGIRSVDLSGDTPHHNATNICERTNEITASDSTGCGSVVYFNTNMHTTPHGYRPPYIALAHELIHALHNLNGDASAVTETEENRTVGLANANGPADITENMIRAEHDIDARARY